MNVAKAGAPPWRGRGEGCPSTGGGVMSRTRFWPPSTSPADVSPISSKIVSRPAAIGRRQRLRQQGVTRERDLPVSNLDSAAPLARVERPRRTPGGER